MNQNRPSTSLVAECRLVAHGLRSIENQVADTLRERIDLRAAAALEAAAEALSAPSETVPTSHGSAAVTPGFSAAYEPTYKVVPPDKDELLSRLFEAMGCDTLEEAVMQAELDTRESLKAAEAIKQCAGLPENVWPSPHERRFFIALKEHLSATLTIPKGWKLVPVEPTEKMKKAGNDTGEFEDDYPRDSRRAARHVYEVMLDAAPSYVGVSSEKDGK